MKYGMVLAVIGISILSEQTKYAGLSSITLTLIFHSRFND